MSVAGHGLRFVERGLDGESLLLGERGVELDHVADDAAKIDRRHGDAGLARFGARNLHQRGEGAQDAVGLGDRTFEGGAVAVFVVWPLAKRKLQPRLQPGERAAQIVRDAVRHRAQARHQRLDLIQHLVDRDGEPVEFVAHARDRHAPREIAAHDALAGLTHGIDPAQHSPAHDEAAEETQNQRNSERATESFQNQPFEVRTAAGVAADEQPEAARQHEGVGADGAVRLLAARTPGRDLHPTVFGPGSLARPGAEIAGERLERGIGEEVDAVRIAVGAAALLDDGDQAADAPRPVLLGKTANLGLDCIAGLAVDDPDRGPVDEREQHQDRGAEEADVEKRKPERGRPEQPSPHLSPQSGCAGRRRAMTEGKKLPCRPVRLPGP